MKRFWLPLRKLIFAVALASMFCACGRAQEGLRYLFLIDHSPEMATRQIPTVQTIYDIVRSGFESEIKPGEQFALWFYGSRLQTNPPVAWKQGQEIAAARYAANLFTGRIYSKRRPRESTLAEAAPFIASSPKLTIFIFTDGGQPLGGTPFDAQVNAAMEKNYGVFMQMDKPFVITIVTRKGKVTDAKIHTDPRAQFQIPESDREDEVMSQALAAMRNATTQKVANAADLDKALAVVRNATPAPAKGNAGEGIDKARAALRDALDGKTDSKPQLAMQTSPALREPAPTQSDAKAEPKTEPKKEEPVVQKTVPPLLARPNVAEAPEPEPKRAEPEPVQPVPTKPVEGTTPEPKPVEKIPEPKPVVHEEVKLPPKPERVEEPKRVVIAESKRVVTEEPKAVQSTPATDPQPPPVAKPVETKTAAPIVSKPELETKRAKPPIQTGVVTPTRKGFPWPILIGGFTAIALGGAVALLRAKQRAKSAGSIITQALPRNGPRFK